MSTAKTPEPVTGDTTKARTTMGSDDIRTLVAGAAGYALEAMDFLFFTLVISLIITDLHATLPQIGLMSSAALISSAVGGYGFGLLADYIGRKKVLIITVLIYSVASLGAATSQTWWQLLAWRVLLGLGMGGEWSSGMALLIEKRWGAANRGKASATIQAMWPLGYLAATGIAAVIVPFFGWRGLFVVGILPALVTFWIRRSVREPERWQEVRRTQRIRPQEIFSRPFLKQTLLLGGLAVSGLWAYEAYAIFLPTFLQGAPAHGGVGLSLADALPLLILFNAIGVVAYIAFGFASDRWGRKAAAIPCALVSAVFGAVVVLASGTQPALAIGIAGVGAFTAFFGAYGVWISESLPTRVRAWGLGLIFNTGRVVGGFAPVVIGGLAASWGLGRAMLIGIPGFVVFAIVAAVTRETRGVKLT